VLISEGPISIWAKNWIWINYYPAGKKSLVANLQRQSVFRESQIYDQDGALKVEMTSKRTL